MEANRDEALKCHQVAQSSLRQGDTAKAIRFLEKSLRIFPTKEAENLLNSLNNRRKTSNGAHSSSESTRNCETSGPSSNDNSSPPKPKPYTKTQEAICREILNAKDLYSVLKVQRSATEDEIRKAYRKLAIQLHPDKNGAPNATDAFKRMSKAFQLLSDRDRRAKYDSGGDEDEVNHHRNESESGMDGFMSAEELFQAFFGFGHGGATIFTGPGGARVYRSSGGGFRPQQGGAAPNLSQTQQRIQTVMQLLPLIIILFFSFFGGSFFGDSTPDFKLSPVRNCNIKAWTTSYGVPFYVSNRFETSYPTRSVGRRDAEAEVEYAWFYHDCVRAHGDIRKDIEYYQIIGARSKVRDLMESLRNKEREHLSCQRMTSLKDSYPMIARKVQTGRSQVLDLSYG